MMIEKFINKNKGKLFLGLIVGIVLWVLVEVMLKYSILTEATMSRLGVVIGYVGSFCATLLSDWKDDVKEIAEVDKESFKKFLRMLPSDGAMLYFEQYGFEHAFPRRYFTEIDVVAVFYEHPGKRFQTPELEKDFREFHNDLREFISKMANYSSPVDADMSAVPKALELSNERLYQERVSELNRRGTDVTRKYVQLVDKWSVNLKISH